MVDQDEIHRKVVSGDVEERRWAAGQLSDNFADLPDKEGAWEDLHRLTADEGGGVRRGAAGALMNAFQHVTDKTQAWEDLHRLTVDEGSGVRRSAAYALMNAFQHVPDKDEAWEDLIRLTGDDDRDVRSHATGALGSAFQHVPDKDEAWEDLIRLTGDDDRDVRGSAAHVLRNAFQHVSDKNGAWEDLIRLTGAEDSRVRTHVADALGSAFQHVPDKDEAWEDLIRLTGDDDRDVRGSAAHVLRNAFQYVSDKNEAWKDIHRLTGAEDSSVRSHATCALGSSFQYVSDKNEAWKDLHRLTRDADSGVRGSAAHVLRNAFQYGPNKNEAWKDLHRLTWDDCWEVRLYATGVFDTAFQYVPNKNEAWKDLIRLTGDECWEVRWYAAGALGSSFQYVSDKNEAWKGMIRLTGAWDYNVRCDAADALGSAFQHVPDKNEAWKDLHRLTWDEDCDVRTHVADALGSAFQHVSDKDEAWKDLIRLTGDEDSCVRASANHSLGRASIFRATCAESEDFGKEIKNALEFFERSSNEMSYSNPARFCLPFYRSFYTITFGKAGAEGEVHKYLAEAKSASEGSKNKEILLEAVENLANALSEAHKARDFDATKSDLKSYMQYCNRAADLIGDAAEGAPGAAQVLRRGGLIINERIREIPDRAEALCRETRDTPLKELGLATARSARELPTQHTLAMTMALGKVAGFARDWCEYLPTDKKADACEQLKNLTDMDLSEQGATLARVLECVQEHIHIPKIQTVHVSDTKQEIVRIAVAQFCFDLTESFPFALKNKDEVKTKVFSALEIVKQNGANIVCLPELCLCEEWISDIRKRCPDMIVIGGSFYKDNQNTCPVMMKSDVDIPRQPKITPAATEYDMMPGAKIYRYETRFGKFVILICMDFDDLAHFFREADIDMIFCPAFNPDNERFHEEANSHVKKTPSYILIANTGLHGGTSIFGQLDDKYLGELADRGCRERKDPIYKLCEVKKGCEEVILADFNLIHKSVQRPTPSNRSKVIKSVDNIRKIPIQPDRSRSESKIGNE